MSEILGKLFLSREYVNLQVGKKASSLEKKGIWKILIFIKWVIFGSSLVFCVSKCCGCLHDKEHPKGQQN